MWNARVGSLGLKARVDIPVGGTVIEVVNDRLRVEHPPNGCPSLQRLGGKNNHDKADKTFEEIVAELAGAIFNKTVFEGSATSQAFEWEICMENKWPRHQHNFRSMWNDGASGQGVGRSRHYISGQEWRAMFHNLPQSQPIVLTRSDYVANLSSTSCRKPASSATASRRSLNSMASKPPSCLMRGEDTSLVTRQHGLLEARQSSAAQLGMHMYGFRVILKKYLCSR